MSDKATKVALPSAKPSRTRDDGLSFGCKLIVCVGVVGVLSKAHRATNSFMRGEDRKTYAYLGTIALIDSATLYMMLGYCRQKRTYEGVFKTMALETFLRLAVIMYFSDGFWDGFGKFVGGFIPIKLSQTTKTTKSSETD